MQQQSHSQNGGNAPFLFFPRFLLPRCNAVVYGRNGNDFEEQKVYSGRRLFAELQCNNATQSSNDDVHLDPDVVLVVVGLVVPRLLVVFSYSVQLPYFSASLLC